MRSIMRHVGAVTNIKRLPSSSNGNPRYSFECNGWTIVTKVDSMHGYELTNYRDKEVSITAGWHYNRLTLNTINRIRATQ